MVKVAIMGFGVVGSGVAEVLAENAALLARRTADEIQLGRILDLRDFPDSPYQALLTKDFADIEGDPDLRVVVETMGGVGAAYEFTKRCLLAGKSVVTSNKELVAMHGHELLTIAREKNVNYLFEASVGGGIPIIRPLTQCLAANAIDEIYGILNGTTNHILTEMIQCGVSFADALADAQERGFAERDPSADVEGLDTCRKISILADLCFGRQVDPACVSTQGISGVDLLDVELARQLGYRIKLLGRALRRTDGRIHAYVAPHLLRGDSLLAGVSGVMNGIVVHGNALGEAMFYGAGAGSRPTASAVVADVIDAARHPHTRRFIGWEAAEPDFVADTDELCSRWYVRSSAPEAELRARFGDISPIEAGGARAFVTEELSGAALRECAADMTLLAAYRILD